MSIREVMNLCEHRPLGHLCGTSTCASIRNASHNGSCQQGHSCWTPTSQRVILVVLMRGSTLQRLMLQGCGILSYRILPKQAMQARPKRSRKHGLVLGAR